MGSPASDPVIDRLAVLFLEHPAWVSAARHISSRATSTVYFSHVPGQAWRLEQHDERTRLLPGAASNPDFIFRFTPKAISRLDAVEGGIGDFAVTLFELMVDDDPELHVGFRIAAGFGRLASRGYLRLLAAAGPRVVTFGAAHGIRTLGALRRFVAGLRARGPEDWESGPGDGPQRPEKGETP